MAGNVFRKLYERTFCYNATLCNFNSIEVNNMSVQYVYLIMEGNAIAKLAAFMVW